MLLKELREQVLETGLRMVADQIAHGAQGNISILDPESKLIAITPSAIPYHALKVEDICVVDLSGKVVEGQWRPTSEMALHLVFYRNRLDVGAVVHSHAPYCSVFGITHEPIPMVLTEAATCLTGPVPVAPYRRPGSEEVAQVTYEAMAPRGVAAVMAHHGLVTVGATLAQAYDSTLAAETSARMVMMARSMGRQEVVLDAEECATMRQIYLTHYKPTSAK